MNKISATLVILVLSVGLYVWMSFNEVSNANDDVIESWQQLQIMFYRRNALIPLLAKVTRKHGLTNPAIMRIVKDSHSAAKISMIPAYHDEQLMDDFRTTQNNLSSILTELIFAANNNADITHDPDYIDLLDKFATTAKSIAIARYTYNKSATNYNHIITRFPTNIIARLFGFEPRVYFTIHKQSSPQLHRFLKYFIKKTDAEDTLLNGI